MRPLTLILFALSLPLVGRGADDPPAPPPAGPDVFVPVPPAPKPPDPGPAPAPTTVDVPVGSFLPVYMRGELKARLRVGDKTLFAPDLRVRKGSVYGGRLFSEATHNHHTMPESAVILLAAKAGTCTVTVDANGADGPETKLELTVRVVGGDGPRPPPDPPGPVSAFTKASRDGVAQVPAAVRSAEAGKLAGKQKALAAAIAAGAVKDEETGQFTPAAALAAWRAGNREAVADPAPWKPWADATAAALQAAYKAGKLPTKAEWAAAFQDIATGLEG